MSLRDLVWSLRSTRRRLTGLSHLLQLSATAQRPQRRPTGLTPACRRVNNVLVIYSDGGSARRMVPCRSVPGATELNTVPYLRTFVCSNAMR